MQYKLPLLGQGSQPLVPRPRQQQLLELQRLLAGQSLDGATHMTLEVAVQWLRDRAEEEVPLSDGGAQRQAHYRHLEQSHDPRSLLDSSMYGQTYRHCDYWTKEVQGPIG